MTISPRTCKHAGKHLDKKCGECQRWIEDQQAAHALKPCGCCTCNPTCDHDTVTAAGEDVEPKEANMSSLNDFKVGDKVREIDLSSMQPGTVVSVVAPYVYVRWDGTNYNRTFDPTSLVKVAEDKPSTNPAYEAMQKADAKELKERRENMNNKLNEFKVGDKVQEVGYPSNEVGTVASINLDGTGIYVEFSNRAGSTFRASDLVKVEDKTPKPVKDHVCCCGSREGMNCGDCGNCKKHMGEDCTVDTLDVYLGVGYDLDENLIAFAAGRSAEFVRDALEPGDWIVKIRLPLQSVKETDPEYRGVPVIDLTK